MYLQNIRRKSFDFSTTSNFQREIIARVKNEVFGLYIGALQQLAKIILGLSQH